MISSVLIFGLSACINNTSTLKQITSLNVDCETKDVQISDDVAELNGEQSWTAKCEGKTYFCTYLSESGSDCYELIE
ncbi:MAG: hypothetical protein KAJ32_10850 [Gammaproteobacteria bacterium]|nr:hypothetical protein [Gammaproteobacteria bacterium]